MRGVKPRSLARMKGWSGGGPAISLITFTGASFRIGLQNAVAYISGDDLGFQY